MARVQGQSQGSPKPTAKPPAAPKKPAPPAASLTAKSEVERTFVAVRLLEAGLERLRLRLQGWAGRETDVTNKATLISLLALVASAEFNKAAEVLAKLQEMGYVAPKVAASPPSWAPNSQIWVKKMRLAEYRAAFGDRPEDFGHLQVAKSIGLQVLVRVGGPESERMWGLLPKAHFSLKQES